VCSYLYLAAAPLTRMLIYDTAHPELIVSLAQTIQGAYCSVCNKAHLASQSVTSTISEPILLLQAICKSVCLSQTQVCASAQHLSCRSQYLSSCMHLNLSDAYYLQSALNSIISNVLSMVAECLVLLTSIISYHKAISYRHTLHITCVPCCCISKQHSSAQS